MEPLQTPQANPVGASEATTQILRLLSHGLTFICLAHHPASHLCLCTLQVAKEVLVRGLLVLSYCFVHKSKSYPSPKVSTTTLRQWGFR